jgi:hypothetical protein
MRIIELTREAVEPPKPLPILPQGVQTPPPAKPLPAPAPAATPAAVNPAPAAPAPAAKPNAAVGNRPMGTPGQRPNPAPGYSPLPKPAEGDPAAFGGGVVNPPSKSGVVSKADLDNYRRDSGNPNATLGQYMNQQQGLTARKGGANDPAVIAARQQTAGPPVGSQEQTASGKNELAKQNIAANKPPAVAPAAPAPAAPAPAAPVTTAAPVAEPVPDASAPINPLRGNFSVAGSSSNNATQPANPMRGIQATNPVASNLATDTTSQPSAPAQPAPVSSGSGGAVNTADGSAVTTRTANQIGDTNPRTGVVTPGSFDKNRAQGDKNLAALKDVGSKISNFIGGNKQTAPPAAPAAGNAAALIPPANPLRGVKESTGMQDPVLVRMQSLAGIRR